MNDLLPKIVSLLFNKTTLSYLVVGLLILYAKFWFSQSEYSPKSIKETIDKNGKVQMEQAKVSLTRDSLIWLKVNDISRDQMIMKMQIDTLTNHQTPEVINNLRLMRQISNQMYNHDNRPTSRNTEPLLPPIKMEPINDSYVETIGLIDDIELSMKSGSLKKKFHQEIN